MSSLNMQHLSLLNVKPILMHNCARTSTQYERVKPCGGDTKDIMNKNNTKYYMLLHRVYNNQHKK